MLPVQDIFPSSPLDEICVLSSEGKNNCRLFKFTKNMANDNKKEAVTHLIANTYFESVYIYIYIYTSLSQKYPTSACLSKHIYSEVISTTSPSKYSFLPILQFSSSGRSTFQPGSPFFFMATSCRVVYCFIALTSSNLRPFNDFFSFGNNLKLRN